MLISYKEMKKIARICVSKMYTTREKNRLPMGQTTAKRAQNVGLPFLFK
nr:MAG TPA: hypothetical protein [Caudoviricetes sp.]